MVQGGSPPTPRASAPPTVVGRGSYTTTIGCCCVFINCRGLQFLSLSLSLSFYLMLALSQEERTRAARALALSLSLSLSLSLALSLCENVHMRL